MTRQRLLAGVMLALLLAWEFRPEAVYPYWEMSDDEWRAFDVLP